MTSRFVGQFLKESPLKHVNKVKNESPGHILIRRLRYIGVFCPSQIFDVENR